jgi:hypothetical protein
MRRATVVRFQTVSWKLPGRLLILSKYMPPLGAPLAFDPCGPNSLAETGRSASRNRWNRSDMASAIGHDPHEADASGRIWPPAGPRL